ncbi:adenylate kinase [Labilibaculum sp. A4]|uniref:Adenylate kinase n=2 Tax=Labilibaculum TaxID=2060722 RepID=A0A425YFR2_9BACT|nr:MULTISPECIES: adenylate kinase [Labilibaculum]MDQ1770301.1 adenylate kinase [Labilibaculum euxinus]MUP37976.1 adenylate kinase [Labilibaculum euxinus]MVB07181.1 adenylate kinase [Labilibaculum euxinus]MWN75480.1 adenylate kinase [Labilibaculum euxinus]PKQ66998.1 adenylate kinase [Labilibaculum manganireducens]
MLNIALFGPPGAGKGTQSKMLIEKYNLAYISTGDILRGEIAEGTELGLQAKDIIKRGGLVPDEIIVQIMEERIQTDTEVNGFLFDGFPRTTVQAYILEGLLLKMNTKLDCMLSLEVPTDQLRNRLLDRAKKENRSDDTEEVISVRLKEYDTKTAPVANFYKEKEIYHGIDGLGGIDQIFERLTSVVDQTLQKSWINLVLLGPPGSGKGTQGRKLAEQFNLEYISTGHLMRQEIKKDTEMGQSAKTYMEKGDIVPDEIAIRLIERQIRKHPDANGFIFKGFPRTIVQAYILDGLLRKLGSVVTSSINLDVSTLESIKRLTYRGKTEGKRLYDDTDIIIHRLEQFEKRSIKVSNYYSKQDKFEIVNGLGSEEDVFKRLTDVVNKSFKKIR